MTGWTTPLPPAPPYDPTSLFLAGSSGWRIARTLNADVGSDGVIRLVAAAASLPPMANAAGTFGNLVLPSNVCVTPAGVMLLLDPVSGTLKRFDRCACVFVPLSSCRTRAPHRGGTGPRAITCCGDTLIVCDPDAGACIAYSLDSLAPRGRFQPPPSTFPKWEPSAAVCHPCGDVLVADRLNGVVHRFSCRGRWTDPPLPGFSKPQALALDCQQRLFAVVIGAAGPELRVVTLDGEPIDLEARADRFGASFPPLPIAVDAAGNLQLGPLCEPDDCRDPGSGWFGPNGDALPVAPAATPIAFPATGEVLIGPLDSRIAACAWHRIVAACEVPPGASLRFSTFTAEEAFTIDQVLQLATWATRQPAATADDWDCLINSPRGRHLWLRAELGSTGASTPAVSRVVVEFPRVTSAQYLPAVFTSEPVSGDFTERLISLFDTTLRGIERQVDLQSRLFDPASAPAARVGAAPIDFLSWLGSWIGVALDRRWSEAERRRFLKRAGALFDRRGTVSGLREQLSILLDLDRYDEECDRSPRPSRCCSGPLNCAPAPPPRRWARPPLILEHFRLRRWLYVGGARLGSESRLWGHRIVNRTSLNVNARVGGSELNLTQDPLRDPHHVYAHQYSVFVPCRYRDSDRDRRALTTLLRGESPAHTRHQLVFVEPRFRVGVQSMIGFDAVVGGVPAGVHLGATPLGAASVLTGTQPPRGVRVGRAGRIGTTTVVR